MPELPEVEVSKCVIKSYLVGNEIKYCIIRNNKLRYLVSKEIEYLTNELVINVKRRAKYLLIQLKYGWIIIHLGMSGSIQILNKYKIAEKHDHIDLILSNGNILRYTDPRRFGAWLWTNNLINCSILSGLGPEPLSINFNNNYLFQITRNRKTNIKSLLMDNKIVVGIGNIYANEILFAAKILPFRIVNSLIKKEINNLIFKTKEILQCSIKYGGTTLKNFLYSNGKLGDFTKKLLIYNKKGYNCIYCNEIIKKIKIKQRSTFFCDNCQN